MDKKPAWTGDAVKQMHIFGIGQQELADEIGVSRRYLCMLLNGERFPEDGRKRVMEGISLLKEKRR